MFLLYNLLLTLTSPIWGIWMWLRTRQRKEAPNWNERMGRYLIPKRTKRLRVWVHAVSVGEVIAVTPILRELRAEKEPPEVILSVTTSSGHQTAREQIADLYDHLVYFPIDVLRFQMAALQTVRPDVVAIMETELWMNFLWSAKVFGARTLLLNGRISDRSFPRSLRLRPFYRILLGNVDRCLMQSETDADRIRALGAFRADVVGNTKFDQASEGTGDWRLLAAELGLSREPGVRKLVVGSLRAEEFDSVAPILARLASEGVQVVVAPRHVERAPELVRAFGVSAPLRSRKQPMQDNLLVLDSYGELNLVYGWAEVVVIGGGFANLGGQNLIQPVAQGKAVVFGPNMQNFRTSAAQVVAAGAGLQVGADELENTLRTLLADDAKRTQMGHIGKALVAQNLGASRRYADLVLSEASLSKAS